MRASLSIRKKVSRLTGRILTVSGVINDRTSAEVDASRGARELDMYYDNTLHLKRATAET